MRRGTARRGTASPRHPEVRAERASKDARPGRGPSPLRDAHKSVLLRVTVNVRLLYLTTVRFGSTISNIRG
ncbi:hypothetical protein U6N80_12225, partial [Cutibacterium acnes]